MPDHVPEKDGCYEFLAEPEPLVYRPLKSIDPCALALHYVNNPFLRDEVPQSVLDPKLPCEVIPRFFTQNRAERVVCNRLLQSFNNKSRSPITCVTWQPPHFQKLLTFSQDGSCCAWDAGSFRIDTIQSLHATGIRAVQWMVDGERLVSGDNFGTIRVHNEELAAVGQCEHVPLERGRKANCQIRDLCVCPTQLKFCSCAEDTTALIWDLTTLQVEHSLNKHGWDVLSGSWHPDMSLIVTGSKDSQVRVWDLRESQPVCTLFAHKQAVTRVRWSPDGKYLISGSRDQSICLYDIHKMSLNQTFKGHDKEVTALAWQPGGLGIFISGSYDGALLHWSIHQGSPVSSMPNAHDGTIWDVAVHPLGHCLVTISHDQSIKVWTR